MKSVNNEIIKQDKYKSPITANIDYTQNLMSIFKREQKTKETLKY